MNIAKFTAMLNAAAKGAKSAEGQSPTDVASAVFTALDEAGFRVQEKQVTKSKAA